MKQTFIKPILVLLAIIFSFNFQAAASHLRGGEITWKCVIEGGKSKYKFKVVVYRNCQGCDGCLGPNDVLYVCDLNGTLNPALNVNKLTADGNIKITRVDVKDVSPACSFPTVNPLDCSAQDEGSLEKHSYESEPIDFTGVLPPTDPNSPFVFSFDQNARDGAVNLKSAVGGGNMVLVAKMYPFYPNGTTNAQSIQECFDNAPDFTEAPAAILYTTGLDFVFNNNANDLDLDNLYYDLGSPYADLSENCPELRPQDEIWENYPYYNELNPFGLLPSQFNFNNYTGEFTFKPLVSGDFVSVIKVSSYKCDQKVSEVYRDFKVKILVPDQTQNSNRYPSFYPPFKDLNGAPSNNYNVVAGKDVLIPIIVRDSLPGNGNGISPQELEFTLNGIAMGANNADTNAGCPFPPCAILSRSKTDYTYSPSNPAPVAIQNIPGEVFGYGYQLGAAYGAGATQNDTVWMYWPTSCSNLNKKDNCNGLESSRYNFVVAAKDNFCRVPGKTIRTFSINILPPDFYLSPPIRCITYDQTTNQVSFNWGVAPGDTTTFVRYEIYRNKTLLFSTPNRHIYSYVDFSPEASPDSFYYVRSINLCGVEDEVSPVKPIKVEAFFTRANQARLTWNPIRTPKLSTAPFYRVYRSQTENPFNWVEITDGDGINTNEAAIDNFSLCSDTTYYKVEQFDSLGCTSVSTIDTIFHPRLLAGFHSNIVCQGEPTQFVLDSLKGGIPPYSTIRWLGEEGFSAGNEDTTTYIFPTHGFKRYTFTVIDSKGCRIDILDSAYVRELPVFTMEKDSACPGAVINFGVNITSPTPIDSIFWQGDYVAADDSFYFSKAGPYFDPFFSNPKYIFYGNGGVGKFPITVTLQDIYGCRTTIVDTARTGEPRIDIINDPSLCYDTKKDSIKIIPRYLTKPYNTVQWIDNANGQVLYQANDGKDAFPLSVVAGRRYVELRIRIEDAKGCLGEVTQTFTLSPWIDFLPDSLCIGELANFRTIHKPISDTVNYTYLWELDANTVSTDRFPIHSYSSNGPKVVSLLLTDLVTNCTTFIKDTLTVREPMSFGVSVDPSCAGELTRLRRVAYPPSTATDTAWEWTIDEFPNVIPNNTIYFEGDSVAELLLPPNDGRYRVILRLNDASTGCWTSIDTVIKVFNQPDIDFDVDSLNCAGQVTQFISKVVGNTPPYIYSWTGDDNFIDSVANPSHTYPEDGDEYYNVTFSVTNGFGCVVSKTKSVRVCDDKRTIVQVPQIFSPGRERNNTLSVNFTNVDDFEMTVYNRWGIVVFNSTDPNFVWDGKDLAGEYLLSGTYVYIVKANGSGKRNYLNKGTIAVLR